MCCMCMQLRCHRIAQRHVEPGGLGCLEPSSNEEQGIGMYVRSTGYTTFEIHYTIPTGIRGIKVKGRFPRCSVPSPLQTKLGRLGGLAQPKKYCTYIGCRRGGHHFSFWEISSSCAAALLPPLLLPPRFPLHWSRPLLFFLFPHCTPHTGTAPSFEKRLVTHTA